MDKDIKEKWVAALRSGEYEQCSGRLHGDDNSHCCLGVLAIVVGREPTTAYTIGDSELHYYGMAKGEDIKPMNMNDDEGKNFNEIADYIEANL